MKRFLALIIILGVVCASVSALAEYDLTRGEITIGYTSSAGSLLNPFMCSERDMISINSLMFESLFKLDGTGEPKPVLAENWEYVDDTWKITIRSGIKCHNGIELVAQDVVDSYSTLLAAGSASPYHGRLSYIMGMVANDAFTITVTGKYSGLITLFALTFPVAQRGTLNQGVPMGTGPYWCVSYSPDYAIRLERNPLWWKKQPIIESIVFIHYWDTAGELSALQAGDIDMFQTRSASAALSKKLKYTSHLDYTTTTYELLIPRLTGDLADVRVRQAIMYAIDYNNLISNMYLDMAQQCEVPIQPGSYLYESRSAVYYYSPERAAQLLQEAGWKDMTGDFWLNKVEDNILRYFEIEILTYDDSSSSVRSNAAKAIATNLQAVGIKATVKELSKEKVLKRLNDNDYTLVLAALNLSEVPDLSPLLTEKGNCNFTGTHSEYMDEMLKTALSTTDENEFKSAYSNIQLKIVDELNIMGIGFRTGMVLSTRLLAGLSSITENNAYNGMEFMEKQ